MSIDIIKGKNRDALKIHIWAPVQEVESSAIDQLRNISALPWVFHHIAAMSDVHYGKGATVGSVVAMKGAVSPAAVGVDIGCGMMAAKTSLDARKLERKLKNLRTTIEETIPVGFFAHEEPIVDALEDVSLRNRVQDLMDEFPSLHPNVQRIFGKAWKQMGTLGGGNHFIELCVDSGTCTCENGSVFMKIGYMKCEDCNGTGKRDPAIWMMLHSGSRNIGKELAEIHIGIARKLAHNQELPDRDLAVFLAGTPEMTAYRHDLFWAQEYAKLNREVMLTLYKNVLRTYWPGVEFEETIACHHNYVAEEIHFGEEVLVTRKGAIRARIGDMGLIPGSMGTKSYVVRGLGNAESFESASHGAGRRMSRGEAKRRFTRADLEEQTKGIECRKDAGIVDEIPSAYKKIEKVMTNQKDLVEIIAELQGVLCVKG